jgi:heme/copper-type cytochrome/quinol oxidase subunit 2
MSALLRRLVVLTAALVLVGLPRAAFACPVCFGASDAPMAQATNAGIMFMLVIVVGVLAGFASFIVYLARRAKIAGEREEAEVAAYRLSGERPTEGIL